ncbi:serine/threonine-protein kinase [Saccharopolyspora taberi]|uniref:non-specific serine/threonine protein kinase n=1 Tax=Saccharopolyspora taberi TaxID=60895 RepID=A0ABN3VEI1_9PSEU
MRSGQLVGGRYRLEDQIGSGGNGVVWRGTDEELYRKVALKHAVSWDGGAGSEHIGRLKREAKILAQVNHPNVVTVHDVVSDNGQWWLVMEHVPARDLAAHGTLPPQRVARIGAQLASALARVHESGIVHRDIKPGNVLVTEDGHPKLGDFGISRVVHGEVTLTDSALITGTPGYLAPEVARSEDPTAASDVFSLGATLFAAVEGVSPYGTSDDARVLVRRAAAGDVDAPRRAGALGPALSAMLKVNPAKRPTAAQVRTMLENITEDEPRARWWPKAVVGVALAAVLAIGAWLVFGPPFGSADDIPAPASALGDPLTADPCALIDPVPLARFGDADEDANYGNFNRCDVIVRSGESEVDVEALLINAELPPQERNASVRGFGLVREPPEGRECARTLLLSDQVHVRITADQDGNGPADLCGMADTAVDTATAALSGGELPRRPAPDPGSLIDADACGILDNEALIRFPGVDANNPDPGFGGWTCRWRSTTSPLSLLVRFDRDQPPNADDGRPVRLGGRSAFVEPGGYGEQSCQVSVVHRHFTGTDGEDLAELMLVVVTGEQPPDRLCELATGLAEPAALRLPPA